jgi:hypothetical protein
MLLHAKRQRNIHIEPTNIELTSEGVARLTRDRVIRYHGVPRKIILERDARHVSRFMHELNRLLGIGINPSTAYHPITEGQTIKQERKSTPCGFFDDVPMEPIEPVRMKSPEPRTIDIVSEPLPRNKGAKRPGQANSEKIAELERQLRRLRQSIDEFRNRSSRVK